MNWTKEQRQVIDLRNCNILVSAAAGSGKTAVLIQRILSRIMDAREPVDVDEFLIVTFTKAAAAQMKERLTRALEQALAEDPDNEHLQRQVMLVPMAQISTIHSFCGYVIQNYFHRTGVDPAYRVGTESELGMLRNDVLEEMLEEKYESPSEEFLQMAGMSRFVKSDKEIEELILYLYDKAVSEPFPRKFLQRMEEFVGMDTVEELKASEFVRRNTEYVRNVLEGIREEYDTMLSLCDAPRGPAAYRDFLVQEAGQFEGVPQEAELEQLGRWVEGITFGRLPGKRQPDCEEELKEAVKGLRGAVKDVVKSLKTEIFDNSLEEQLEQLRQIRGTVCSFLHLTGEFMERYRAKKEEKSLADFNDLEQMAMEILLEENGDGRVQPTVAAKELSGQFVEIMIDEYQDSNRVQDMLLGSVASADNVFMVGDIKQSIYRFRMACPELFLEKLHRYSTKEGERDRLVCLSRNFRSRDVVIEGTNSIFEQIMQPKLGGVEYDEDARLRLGADYPESGQRLAESVDVLAIDGKDDGSYEGKLIAELIREYTGEENPLYVQGKDGYRPCGYGDIVILARSTKIIGQQIYDALAAEGIPVHMENTRGFFETREISLMVSLFQIIDNPRQDIPLAAVLRSPVFGFSDDELAQLRGKYKNMDFYDSLLHFVDSQEEEGDLQEKTRQFLELLERFREEMTYATVSDMIQDIYNCTKMDYMLAVMSNGLQRKANLELLMEVAREFDSTSYKGLHQFVRYISGIKKREEDLGEANLSGDREDVVRIMTIHKSKGLEFPVCILAGMGRSITGARSRSFLVVHPEVGIAAPVVDNDMGISVSHTFTRSLVRMNLLEDLGEELRVLYVAMTRAKEKLVMTGCTRQDKCPVGTGYFQLIRAKSYFDWVLPAVQGNDWFRVRWLETEELEKAEIQRQADVMVDEVMLNNFDTNITYDKTIKEMLSFMDEHQGQDELEIPTKLSVSELKKRSMEESIEVLAGDALENQSPVPVFAREDSEEDQAIAGAGYGTVWHQVMAGLRFSAVQSEQDLEGELGELVESGRMRAEDMKYIRKHKLMKFLASSLGSQMRKAQVEGRLYREQPFVTMIPAAEVVPEAADRERVLVQGIIDGFYETEEGIVLMDYKTDHLEPGQEGILVERYEKQMELYARALEGILGKRVVRKVLYSFSLDKEIELE
ncbi:MAG: helicase-exonuclease AddAB subunit AddA [Eubacterium sp.]|nr:helicase-exonuclease AddAB subunit AddA [Eubacterium sp.]